MKRLAVIILLSLAVLRPCAVAQELSILGIRFGSVDVRDLGLATGAGSAADNSAAFNSALLTSEKASATGYHFPAGDWYFAEDTTSVRSNPISLDGSPTGATDSASSRVTVTGLSVSEAHIGGVLEITSGGAWLNGHYEIQAVDDVGDNDWILDRPCTSGAATGLTGTVTFGVYGTCIQQRRATGTTFWGTGVSKGELAGHTNNKGTVNLFYAGPRVSFDGASVTAAAAGGDRVLVNTTPGYTEKINDIGATLQITDGTNFEKGFYVVTGLDASGNWVLDRDPTLDNGTAASGMVGLMTYSLWRVQGARSIYSGLNLRGNSTPGSTVCHVGMHVETNLRSLPTGSHEIKDAFYSDMTVPILCGRNMASAYGMRVPRAGTTDIGYGTGVDYPGATQFSSPASGINHADGMLIRNIITNKVRTLLYARNYQSVGHRLVHIGMAQNPEDGEMVYCERVLDVDIEDVAMLNNRGTILRIGILQPNSSLAKISKVKADNNADPLALVKMDANRGEEEADIPHPSSTDGTVIIDGVDLPPGIVYGPQEDPPQSIEPIIDLFGGVRCELRNGKGALPAECIRLVAHNEDATWKPVMNIENCTIADSVLSVGQEGILHDDCSAGVTVDFRRNSTLNGNETIGRNGRYVVGTGYVSEELPPVPATDQMDGVTIWSDNGVLKVSSGP